MEELKKIVEQWKCVSMFAECTDIRIRLWIDAIKLLKGETMVDEDGHACAILEVFEDYDRETGMFKLYATVRKLIDFKNVKVLELNDIVDWKLFKPLLK